MTKTGIIFLKFPDLPSKFIFGAQDTKVIKGIVPNPNANMYKEPPHKFEDAKAPNTAMYTRPQGRNPFKNPMVNNVFASFFLSSFPNLDFILPTKEYMFFDNRLFAAILGNRTNVIISNPEKIEMYC